MVHKASIDFASVNFGDEMVCSGKPYGNGCRQRCFVWTVAV